MVEVHEKLSRGKKIDPQIVSVLLLGGIINITSQHDAMDELEAKIKELEVEKGTTKTRLEALENWVLKQSDATESLSEHVTKIDASVLRLNENPQNVAAEEKAENLETKMKIECKETVTLKCMWKNTC